MLRLHKYGVSDKLLNFVAHRFSLFAPPISCFPHPSTNEAINEDDGENSDVNAMTGDDFGLVKRRNPFFKSPSARQFSVYFGAFLQLFHVFLPLY